MPLIWSWVWGSVFNDEKSGGESKGAWNMDLDFQREGIRLSWPVGLISTQTGLKHENRFFFSFALCVVIILSKNWFQIYSRLRWILSLSEGDLIVLFLKTWPLPFGLKTSARAPQMALCLRFSVRGRRLWRQVIVFCSHKASYFFSRSQRGEQMAACTAPAFSDRSWRLHFGVLWNSRHHLFVT